MKLTRRDFTAGLAAGITAPYVIVGARAQGARRPRGFTKTARAPSEHENLTTSRMAAVGQNELLERHGMARVATAFRKEKLAHNLYITTVLSVEPMHT